MNAVARHVAPGMLGLIAAAVAGCSDPAPVEPGPDAAALDGAVAIDAAGEVDAGGDAGAACATPAACEQRAVERFDAILGDPAALDAFLTAVPKGGDLHQHLSGAVYAETYLDWARADGVCINTTTFAAVTTVAVTARITSRSGNHHLPVRAV